MYISMNSYDLMCKETKLISCFMSQTLQKMMLDLKNQINIYLSVWLSTSNCYNCTRQMSPLSVLRPWDINIYTIYYSFIYHNEYQLNHTDLNIMTKVFYYMCEIAFKKCSNSFSKYYWGITIANDT